MTSSVDVDGLVADYLRRLESALSRLPAARRRQLLAEIAEHLGEARAQLDGSDEIAVRELLDRMGRPEDIAAEAVSGLVERPNWRHRPITLIGAAVVVLVACLAAALIIGRINGSATASGSQPAVATSLTLPNAFGQTSSSAASRLEAMGLAVVLVPEPSSTAPVGTVIGEQPTAGSVVRPGATVTLTYVAAPSPPPTSTTTSAPPTTTPPPVNNVATKPSSGTPVSDPLIPSGIYVNGLQGTPHYFVSLTNGTGGAVSGSVNFLFLDGQTEVAFTFTGTTHNGVMTLYPANVQTYPPGRTQITKDVPSAISAIDNHNAFGLGECIGYLPEVGSLAECAFSYSPGGPAGSA